MSEDIRSRLLALRAEIEGVAEVSDESAQPVTLDQTSVGRLSRMDAMQNQAMAQATQARRAQLLRGIESALQRLQAGEYGLCLECDEAINPKRLEIDPTAEYCIRCAEARQ